MPAPRMKLRWILLALAWFSAACFGGEYTLANGTGGNGAGASDSVGGDAAPGTCNPGQRTECYSGPAETAFRGTCHPGTAVCGADGRTLGACEGEVVPTTEDCNTEADEDCDGVPNGTCPCDPGITRDCYSADPSTKGVGACRAGHQSCDGSGHWATCVNEVTPKTEDCFTAKDDDCDGFTNEIEAGCCAGACTGGQQKECYTGAPGTELNLPCHAGVQICDANGKWGTCTGETTPKESENCDTPGDDDCDGQSNENCGTCLPNGSAVEPGTGATQCCSGIAALDNTDFSIDRCCNVDLEESCFSGDYCCAYDYETVCEANRCCVPSNALTPGSSKCCSGQSETNINGLTFCL